MEDSTTALSIEQQFQLKHFQLQVEKMSHDQAKSFLVSLYQQMLARESMYKQFIKHEWGLK